MEITTDSEGTIASIIQPYIDAGDLLGAAVAIIREGEIVSTGGFGVTSDEVIGQPLSNNCFTSRHGVIEFEVHGPENRPVLVWGKATRYYAIDEQAWHTQGILRFCVPLSSRA